MRLAVTLGGFDRETGLGQRLEVAADGPLGDAVAGLVWASVSVSPRDRPSRASKNAPLADDLGMPFHGWLSQGSRVSGTRYAVVCNRVQGVRRGCHPDLTCQGRRIR